MAETTKDMGENGNMSKESFELENNPLLNPPAQPFNAPPLGLFKPAQVEPAVDRALELARKDIDAIVGNPDEPTFANTIHALAFAGEDLGRVMKPFSEMMLALNTNEVQAVMGNIQPKLVQYGLEVQLNEELFKKVKKVYDTADRKTLSIEEKTLLDNTYNGFVNNGALLEGAQRDEYKDLAQKLSRLAMEYGNNIVNSTKSLKVVIKAADAHRMAGIPADFIESYRENAKQSDDPGVSADDYVIKMSPPPLAVYDYATDRSLREEVKRTQEKIGSTPPHDNTQIVHDILDARFKIAKLLGFKNHAERVIRPDTRMAQSPQKALDFVKKNLAVYHPAARDFFKEMADFARDRDGVQELKSWDRLYYIRLMGEEKIGFKSEESRPYLELESVLKGIFEHGQKLYGIKVQEADGKYSKMHEDIRTYEILDAKTNAVKALYFLDPYARDYKKAGAWMTDVRNAGLHKGQQEIPVAGNYCNFNKPAPGEPTLLDPGSVRTLFHEFGHACHAMMGRGTYPELTGTNTAWDYVELPSQINERWAFRPEVLATYAKHHETGAPMPAGMVDKLQKMPQFDAKWVGIRQMEMALIDLLIHTTDPAKITDLRAFQDTAWKSTEIIKWDAPPVVLTFSHIMSSAYDAGYYSYKWADALVADVFEQFETQGLYNPSLCESFKRTMIEPGGTVPPADMHKDFMEASGQGRRDLDPEALFRAEGLLPPKPPAPKAP